MAAGPRVLAELLPRVSRLLTTTDSASLPRYSTCAGSLVRWLLWSNVAIAASNAGWVILSARALGIPFDWALFTLAFALGLATYTHDRLGATQRARDRESMPERTAWIEANLVALRRSRTAAYGYAALMLVLRPTAALPILAGGILALLYTVPWVPLRGHRASFKDLPALKMPLVATLFSVSGVLVPALHVGRLAEEATWTLAATTTLLVMAQVLVNDLRDVDVDARHRTRSLPVLIGGAWARSVGLVFVALAAGIGAPLAPLPIAGVALYSGLLLVVYERRSDARWRPFIELQGVVAAVLSAF